MKIKKFDYLEFTIKEFKHKKEVKTFPKEEIKIYIGLDPFDERIENFLIGQEFTEEILTFVNPEDKKNVFEIQLLKHFKTPERFVNLIIEMKYLNTQIDSRDEEIAKLNKAYSESKAKYDVAELTFKKEVETLQAKAQATINEHVNKNNEHLKVRIDEEKKFALQKFFEKFIIPLNNLDLATKAANNIQNDIVTNFNTGFKMLYKQMDSILEEFGISKIIPLVRDKYNPEIHQVYEMIEAKSEKEKDLIAEIKNIGYKLNDRTIKPALVVVYK